ncbi:cysteine--tRNA ligase [Oleidesulfovibrio alaskensis]|jgi:cysteinyl-tRNA synthetase|uniref:cysteine--tRNA ligase n=1 Tax=Oleidesulfovibrio alaskensis TaxID=58180 RepID=UPI0003F565DF|nr:cysteine--tRNA ligase [Oleidesulfovibrio alaskensis]MBL3581055.1 cysteine--tRNA ligase [Oleidesulfovibrio alaskensis]
MQLYNTLTRKKEKFIPQREGKASVYVCGITAYDLCHLGHARSSVAFDVLVRYLRHTGLDVTFVRNFTDVDDKIIKRAGETGLTSTEVAEKYMAAFHEDMDRLGCLRADIEPRCTQHIGEMIALCEDLISKGKAYSTASGDVYFRVRSFASYGKLSGRDVDDMRSGARVAPGEEKEDPLDFALWKSAKPGEPYWESPWGNGRPGWHIECSAMSEKHLPLPLDIHGGGQDLVFPHHENEIAQTEAATGKEFARYWVHNGFVQVNAEKMSKSLGNFSTIRDILQGYLPETLRYFLLTKHYRSPIDFTFDGMDEAEKNLRRIYQTLNLVENELQKTKWSAAPLPEEVLSEMDETERAWNEAMEDDLNTAAALGHIFGLVRLVNRIIEDKTMRKSAQARDALLRMQSMMARWGAVLGLFTRQPAEFLREMRDCRAARRDVDTARVETLLLERQEARKAKDFERSDAIREELARMGVEVQDTPAGAVWDIA